MVYRQLCADRELTSATGLGSRFDNPDVVDTISVQLWTDLT